MASYHDPATTLKSRSVLVSDSMLPRSASWTPSLTSTVHGKRRQIRRRVRLCARLPTLTFFQELCTFVFTRQRICHSVLYLIPKRDPRLNFQIVRSVAMELCLLKRVNRSAYSSSFCNLSRQSELELGLMPPYKRRWQLTDSWEHPFGGFVTTYAQ